MRQIKKPKGIKVKFFEKSKFSYHLCPNCYEYLMFDECPECGLICKIADAENFDVRTKDISNVKEITKFLESIFKIFEEAR